MRDGGTVFCPTESTSILPCKLFVHSERRHTKPRKTVRLGNNTQNQAPSSQGGVNLVIYELFFLLGCNVTKLINNKMKNLSVLHLNYANHIKIVQHACVCFRYFFLTLLKSQLYNIAASCLVSRRNLACSHFKEQAYKALMFKLVTAENIVFC